MLAVIPGNEPDEALISYGKIFQFSQYSRRFFIPQLLSVQKFPNFLIDRIIKVRNEQVSNFLEGSRYVCATVAYNITRNKT